MGWLLNHMGVDAADVVAFGDGENDIEMLQAAGVGCVCPPPPRDTGQGFHPSDYLTLRFMYGTTYGQQTKARHIHG